MHAGARFARLERVIKGITLCAVLAACGNAPAATHPVIEPPPLATAADIDEDAVSDLFDRDRHHHYGGITMFAAMSIDSLGVTPVEDGPVRSTQRDLYATMRSARDAESAVFAAIIDGLTAGTFDRPRIDDAIDRLRVDAASVRSAATDALNRLHAVLSSEQRATLADKVEAHWTVWRQANPADEENRPRGQLAVVAQSLSLSPRELDGHGHASMPSGHRYEGSRNVAATHGGGNHGHR